MEAGRLLEWIDDPAQLNGAAAESLNDILDSFPYFVPARMLQLKALEQENSFRYNGQLKKTAAYVPDRTVLFDFITKASIAPQAPTEESQEEVLETSSPNMAPSAERQLEDVLEEPEENTEIEEAIREAGDAEPVIGRPLKFDRSERHSFAQWLKLTSMKPIDRDTENAEPAVEQDNSTEELPDTKLEESTEEERPISRQDLIDRFLAESPRMSPPQKMALGKGNIARASLEEDDSLMTETLARVYTEQGLYDKAIKAYRLLSLKYPEKSGYFADRINEINDLKERK
ncbi:hypothetical protein HZ996_01130 [Cryomorphaceae bacterium]|nr:hypothetical protein HZ996_01130 [Cryomorphaceae bacterium]